MQNNAPLDWVERERESVDVSRWARASDVLLAAVVAGWAGEAEWLADRRGSQLETLKWRAETTATECVLCQKREIVVSDERKVSRFYK